MKLEDLFYYDETSPSGLRRKTVWKCGRNTIRGVIGDTVGWLSHHGYYKLLVNKKYMYAHSIIWQLHYGAIPKGYVIDHIDGNGGNNNIENLRAVTRSHNMQNMKMPSDNTTGHVGVVESREGNYRRFIAQCNNLDGSNHSKSFNINKYGREAALRLAIEYREEYIKKLNTQGACYTERHGKFEEQVDVNPSNS